MQVAWLAAAVFIVSAGYGALLPAARLVGVDDARRKPPLKSVVTSAFSAACTRPACCSGAPLWGRIGSLRAQPNPDRQDGRLCGQPAAPAGTGDGRFVGHLRACAARPAFRGGGRFLMVRRWSPKHAKARRARRFAWMGAMSLLGFLFGPALSLPWPSGSDHGLRRGLATGGFPSTFGQIVLVLSATLGGTMMLGGWRVACVIDAGKTANQNR